MKDHKKRLIEILDVLRKEELTKGVTPEKFREIIEKLGPTFIKLGQIMSMRSDILPQNYCNELKKLQNSVRPMSFFAVKKIIEDSYGIPIEEVFEVFDEEPIGSASIAQVHKAILKDGKEVVAKVQRENIYEIMSRDIALLKKALKMLKLTGITGDVIDFDLVLNEMWQVAKQEMDFLIEAGNIQEFAKLNEDIVYVKCPVVIMEYTNSKVLVMEYIDGIPISEKNLLEANGYELKEIGEKLANNYVKQILDDAFFHADPHPGNIQIKDGKIVWLDLGMMGRLTLNDQKLLRQAALSFVGRDISGIKNVILTMGTITGPINHSSLYEDIDFLLNKYGDISIEEMNLGSMMEEFLEIAKRNNIAMPEGISMLSRGMLTVQGVLKVLSPEVNVIEIMKNYLSSSLLGQVDLKNELSSLLKQLLFSSKKAVNMPAELLDLVKMTLKGQSKVNIELRGSEQSLISINNMVNKLVLGLITVGLLIGSSIICVTKMKPEVLGIPALGFVGFLAAFILGIILIIEVKRN